VADVAVVGAGYVGLVTGACLASLGHSVTGVEIDPHRLASLQRGEPPVREPGLDELVESALQARRLRFTSDYSDAASTSRFAFIAVNTPPGPGGEADTSFVFSAVDSIIQHAPPGLIIVVKSTVPIGTGDEVARLAARSGKGIETVSNPEFLRQGSAVQDFLHPDRIVIGASSKEAAAEVAALYEELDAPILKCSRPSAELAKYAANALLATRISFMNEISIISESVEADMDEVQQIVGADRRIGSSFLSAGLGWGGSCFPKDVLALIHTAVSRGGTPAILQSVFDVNVRQRERAFQKLSACLDGADGPTVGVLGLAFKSDTDDVRGSPSLDIISRLLQQEINVRAHDPAAMHNARRVLPNITFCEDAYDVARGCHVLLLATEWNEYLSLDWEKVLSLMSGRAIVDGRNVLDAEALSRLGFHYTSFGRHVNGADGAHLFASEAAEANRAWVQEAAS
jgi:UDPglucose 6-dehydrogenase